RGRRGVLLSTDATIRIIRDGACLPGSIRARRRGPAMTKTRVLIVDDEPEMANSCVRILGRTGYECLTATDPRLALDLLESKRPEVLLTDLKLPDVDGMTFLRRARERDPALPVIAVTFESETAAIEEGAFDCLPKNFSPEQLRIAVDRAIRHRGLQVENRNL